MKKGNRESRFLKAIMKKPMTRAAATKRFSLKNPSAAVLRFEDAGVDIGRKYTYNKKGRYTSVTYSTNMK